MELIVVLILVVLLLCSAYWYAKQNYNYWKRLGIPYSPAIVPLGSIYKNLFRVVQEVEVENYKKYGRIYGYYEGFRPHLTVSDPDLLRNIYVKDFHYFTNRRDLSVGDPIFDNAVSVLTGERWKQVRTIITPAFTTGKIKRMTSIILDSAKTLAKNFEKSVSLNEPVDAKRNFGAFTMDVIASSAFGTKVDSHNDPDNEFVTAARDVFTRNVSWRIILFFLLPSIMTFFKVSIFAPKSLNFFKRVTLEIIKERKRTGQTRNDFLQVLLEAAGETKETLESKEIEEIEEEEPVLSENLSKEQKSLSQNELIAQCVIFFLAGYDTTASTLSFACYELALNPDIQERLIAEVDSILEKNKGQITYEGIQEMKYLENAISETLRKYPPLIRLERQANDDYTLGDTGIVVPKGMIIGTPIYAMQRDPEYFPDPEKFDPDRFTPDAKAARHQYTYLPFGQGPRNCLGMRFAMMEIKICLAYVFSQFRVKRCPETKVPLDYYIGQGLLQPKAIVLRVEPRTDKVQA